MARAALLLHAATAFDMRSSLPPKDNRPKTYDRAHQA